MGQLVFQAALGGQVNLVGPNTASTLNLNVPAVASTLATLAAQTFAGTQTFTVDAVINGLTVGKGGGAVATNTAVGYQAGYSNTTGTNNAYFGANAGQNTTTPNSNTAIGQAALYTNTTGATNTAIGQSSLYYSTTAGFNTAIGYSAGVSVTTSGSNVFIGASSGGVQATGFQNTHIGYGTNSSASTASNEIVIGQGSTGKGSNTGFINPNTGGVYQGNNSLSWSVTSDQRLKKNIVDNNIGLDIINQIQVRNFEYRLPKEVTDLPQNQAIEKTGIQLGVIAQELQQILPECVKTESTGVMTVDADNLTWYLVNAIKELKAEIDALKGV